MSMMFHKRGWLSTHQYGLCPLKEFPSDSALTLPHIHIPYAMFLAIAHLFFCYIPNSGWVIESLYHLVSLLHVILMSVPKKKVENTYGQEDVINRWGFTEPWWDSNCERDGHRCYALITMAHMKMAESHQAFEREIYREIIDKSPKYTDTSLINLRVENHSFLQVFPWIKLHTEPSPKPWHRPHPACRSRLGAALGVMFRTGTMVLRSEHRMEQWTNRYLCEIFFDIEIYSL